MSWLFKHRFKTENGLLKTSSWHHRYLSTGFDEIPYLFSFLSSYWYIHNNCISYYNGNLWVNDYDTLMFHWKLVLSDYYCPDPVIYYIT